MAITAIEYELFKSLRERNILPLNIDILQLGEANWYGDIPLKILKQDILQWASEDRKQSLINDLTKLVSENNPDKFFDIANIWWQTFWQPQSLTAIDFHGTATALKLDLNWPIVLPKKYGAIMNLGTAEHVFNVGQVFKTIHDYTLPGGIMVHGLPFSGWVDHGFYNFNSTFYWDLAQANRYVVMVCVYTELNPKRFIQLNNRESILELAKNKMIGPNSLIYTILRKPSQDKEFQIPTQGYYAGTISPNAAETWKSLR